MALMALDLWNQHTYRDEICYPRQFVDCKVLDAIAGVEFLNKHRLMVQIVGEMIEGTGLEMVHIVRRIKRPPQRKQAVCVAARVMQFVILRGFKGFPWNSTRTAFVEMFFSKDFLIETDPFYPMPIQVQVSQSSVPQVQTSAQVQTSSQVQTSAAQRVSIRSRWGKKEDPKIYWNRILCQIRAHGISAKHLMDVAKLEAKAKVRLRFLYSISKHL